MWRKGKAPSLHKPLAEQEAFWIVGVLYKADVANNSEGSSNQSPPPSLLCQGFRLHATSPQPILSGNMCLDKGIQCLYTCSLTL